MDVWVNFKNATKWQAEGIFKCFFPVKPAPQPIDPKDPTSQQNLAVPKRQKPSTVTHSLSEEEVCVLAKAFADAIPNDEFSVSCHFRIVL